MVERSREGSNPEGGTEIAPIYKTLAQPQGGLMPPPLRTRKKK